MVDLARSLLYQPIDKITIHRRTVYEKGSEFQEIIFDRFIDYRNFLKEIYIYGGKIIMSVGLWVAVTVVLGLAAMGLCFLFLKACEKI
jgi:hypothetical protein